MIESTRDIPVYLEVGAKRTFAGGLDWPGWCRRGTDEASALQALADYGERYAHVLAGTTLAFHPPADSSALTVVERLAGNSGTDFGAANVPPACDADPFDTTDLARAHTVLEAIWRAFDIAIATGTGKELSKGPRGGGRELEKIVLHVLESDAGYLSRVAQNVPAGATADLATRRALTRQTMLETLEAGARG